MILFQTQTLFGFQQNIAKHAKLSDKLGVLTLSTALCAYDIGH